jgi:hypothetical protein
VQRGMPQRRSPSRTNHLRRFSREVIDLDARELKAHRLADRTSTSSRDEVPRVLTEHCPVLSERGAKYAFEPKLVALRYSPAPHSRREDGSSGGSSTPNKCERN